MFVTVSQGMQESEGGEQQQASPLPSETRLAFNLKAHTLLTTHTTTTTIHSTRHTDKDKRATTMLVAGWSFS